MTTTIAVGSVKGTGGATATALGLAGAIAEDGTATVLVEADPSGGSLLGWSEHLDAARPSLYDAVSQNDLALAMQPLGQVRVVPVQGDPWRITVALDRVRRWTPLLHDTGATVVVDVGRLHPSSPALRIAAEVNVLVLVAPLEAGPLAATIEWARRGGQTSATDTALDVARIRLVTVDATVTRRARVDPNGLTRDDLGVAYAGHVPFDDGALELLCRGTGLGHRRLSKSKLAYAHRQLVASLANTIRSEVTP
ncbi:MAG: hypothetical protein AAFP84_19420 [Actinomycetota bacterium]